MENLRMSINPCRQLWLALLATLFLASPVRAAETMDELTRQVAAYELTLPKIEAYGAAISSLADWMAANPKEAAEIVARAPKGTANVKSSLAFSESEPAIMAILKRHQLSSTDYLLIPAATVQAGVAAVGVQQGRTFPADRINPKNVELVQANMARISAIVTKVRADQARIAGRKN